MVRFIQPRAAIATYFCCLSAIPLHGQTPTIGSSKVDVLIDTDADSKADPGEVIRCNFNCSDSGTGHQ